MIEIKHSRYLQKSVPDEVILQKQDEKQKIKFLQKFKMCYRKCIEFIFKICHDDEIKHKEEDLYQTSLNFNTYLNSMIFFD